MNGSRTELAAVEAIEAAAASGLHYVTDREPGFRRHRASKGFVYSQPDGRRVTDAATIKRINSLAIPPAYRDVWICPDPNGHLQATGRDARGRKQYRYHPRWRVVRDVAKFDRMLAFGRALPRVRRRVRSDLGEPGLSRKRVLATLVRLLESTLIRVGNSEYARENGSYGLTTLRNRHVEIAGTTLRFEFRGKSGIRRSVTVSDPRVARIVRQCRELPGQELFQYLDAEGSRHTVGSSDVNDYLREVSGGEFTAKDYRTWYGTALALRLLREQAFRTEREAKRNVVAVMTEVAARLGNTPAICRKCYVHPEVVERYVARTLVTAPLQSSSSSSSPKRVSEQRALIEFLSELSNAAGHESKKPARKPARAERSRTAQSTRTEDHARHPIHAKRTAHTQREGHAKSGRANAAA